MIIYCQFKKFGLSLIKLKDICIEILHIFIYFHCNFSTKISVNDDEVTTIITHNMTDVM